jgi:lysine-N-methylase
MKLTVLQDERFTCQSCSSCCRSWYVELMPGEAERIAGLAWPENDALRGVKLIVRHGGKQMLGRRPDGACLFLNESNGLCRIHEQFGVANKPLGCRVFPFQIAPTFDGEASVIGRFDCPTIRKNAGADFAEAHAELRRFASQMELSDTFDEQTRSRLMRDQIAAVGDFVGTMMNAFSQGAERAVFIASLADLLEMTDPAEVSRDTLASIFPRLKELVEANCKAQTRRPGWFTRMAFRTMLGLYMRRDEDVLTGRAGRLARTIALTKIVLGFGSFRAMGLSHRPGKLSHARLFRSTIAQPTADEFALLWRVIRNRLDSFQFMGRGNNDRNFLSGLRSLALLYPLVVAVSKYSAGDRGATSLSADDIDYAVASIEHSFGRLRVLNESMMRSIEKLLLDSKKFNRLVSHV